MKSVLNSVNGKRHIPRNINEEQWAQLYAEGAEEDVQLAEAGLMDYETGLERDNGNEEG